MLKKVILILMILVFQIVVMILCVEFGRSYGIRAYSKEVNLSTAVVELSRYSTLRDIALLIKAGKNNEAKCVAEMTATSDYKFLELCTETTDCKTEVLNKAKKFAPEILHEKSVPFELKNSCDLTGSVLNPSNSDN